jgi:hypothetical protein
MVSPLKTKHKRTWLKFQTNYLYHFQINLPTLKNYELKTAGQNTQWHSLLTL